MLLKNMVFLYPFNLLCLEEKSQVYYLKNNVKFSNETQIVETKQDYVDRLPNLIASIFNNLQKSDYFLNVSYILKNEVFIMMSPIQLST